MINLSHLIDHIIDETSFETIEDNYQAPETTTPTNSPTKVYVDYESMVSPVEEAINVDSASEVGTTVSLLILITLDAAKTSYPNSLIDLYKACEHYTPESPIKEQVRVLSFVNGQFLSSGSRRIWKSLWAVTFDRFIR